MPEPTATAAPAAAANRPRKRRLENSFSSSPTGSSARAGDVIGHPCPSVELAQDSAGATPSSSETCLLFLESFLTKYHLLGSSRRMT
jgi:hypothetical protein